MFGFAYSSRFTFEREIAIYIISGKARFRFCSKCVYELGSRLALRFRRSQFIHQMCQIISHQHEFKLCRKNLKNQKTINMVQIGVDGKDTFVMQVAHSAGWQALPQILLSQIGAIISAVSVVANQQRAGTAISVGRT